LKTRRKVFGSGGIFREQAQRLVDDLFGLEKIGYVAFLVLQDRHSGAPTDGRRARNPVTTCAQSLSLKVTGFRIARKNARPE